MRFHFFKSNISIFYEFHRPPYGGGNQFLLALKHEFERRKLRVAINWIDASTQLCLFNSHNFNYLKLERQINKCTQCVIIHRVDGPIGLYRGKDFEVDRKIFEYNNRFADATVFQSQWSLHETLKLGFKPKNPVVIRNAVDSNIFHPYGRIPFSLDRKIRLISTSWSDNPRKGASIYKWIEDHLDWSMFEYTFVGRTPIKFDKIKIIKPQNSKQLAAILRKHDIYITASQKDPCSNALLEALSCGLPAVYLDDGGHPELAGSAGMAFKNNEEIISKIQEIVSDYQRFKNLISIPSIKDVADQYLSLAKSKSL